MLRMEELPQEVTGTIEQLEKMFCGSLVPAFATAEVVVCPEPAKPNFVVDPDHLEISY